MDQKGLFLVAGGRISAITYLVSSGVVKYFAKAKSYPLVDHKPGRSPLRPNLYQNLLLSQIMVLFLAVH